MDGVQSAENCDRKPGGEQTTTSNVFFREGRSKKISKYIPATLTIIVLDLGDVIPSDRQGQLSAIRQQF